VSELGIGILVNFSYELNIRPVLPEPIIHRVRKTARWLTKEEMFKLTKLINDHVEDRSSLFGNDKETQDKIAEHHINEKLIKDRVVKLAGQNALEALNQQLLSRAKARKDAGRNEAAKEEDGQENGRPNALGKRPRQFVAPERKTNSELVHQLLIDPEFVSKNIDNPNNFEFIHLHAIDIFGEQFWNSVEDELSMKSPVFLHTKRILRELHNSIKSLHVATGPFVVEYEKTPPFDFIHFYIYDDNFTLRSLMRVMVKIKRVLDSCFAVFVSAPCKEGGIKLHDKEVDFKGLVKNDRMDKNDPMETDSNTSELEWKMAERSMKECILFLDEEEEEMHAFTRALRFLVKDAKKLLATASNVRLLLLKPVVDKHGIVYERDKFKWLAGGEMTTTRACIRETVRAHVDKGLLKTSDFSTNDSVQATHSKTILADFFISVLVQRPHTTKEECPETLFLDMQDIIQMQEQYTRLVTISSMIVVMGKRFGEVKIPNPGFHMDNITEVLIRMESTFDTFASMIEVVRDELDKIPEMVYGDKDTVCRVIAKSNDKYRPVPKLMTKRLRGVLSTALHDDNIDMSNDNDVSTLCSKLQLPRAVLAVVKHTFKLGTKLKSIMDLNLKVHGDIYKKIVGEEFTAKAPAVANSSDVLMADVAV